MIGAGAAAAVAAHFPWAFVSVAPNAAIFANYASMAGPREGRVFTASAINREAPSGPKEVRFRAAIDCKSHAIAYLSRDTFDAAGRHLAAEGAGPYRKILPGTGGADLERFACGPADFLGIPKSALPVMLPIRIVADQFFRLRNLGLRVEAAQALAAADATRAPNEFEQLLNVMVPMDQQRAVRAIKTPDAPVL